MIIPDSVVEAACRAWWDSDRPRSAREGTWDRMIREGNLVIPTYHRSRMRAALEAAAPMLRDQPYTCPTCKGNGILAVVVDKAVTYPVCQTCLGDRVVWPPKPLPQPPKEDER